MKGQLCHPGDAAVVPPVTWTQWSRERLSQLPRPHSLTILWAHLHGPHPVQWELRPGEETG